MGSERILSQAIKALESKKDKGRESKWVCLFFINLFIYLWLHWVFVAACGLSLAAANGSTLCCSARASHCGGFSCCRAWALDAWASVAVTHGLSSCGARA